MDWEKILAKHIFVSGFVYKIFKYTFEELSSNKQSFRCVITPKNHFLQFGYKLQKQ